MTNEEKLHEAVACVLHGASKITRIKGNTYEKSIIFKSHLYTALAWIEDILENEPDRNENNDSNQEDTTERSLKRLFLEQCKLAE